MKKGFLAPFKGKRHYLSDFQEGRRPKIPEENFNYLHSSLRSVIERTFGI